MTKIGIVQAPPDGRKVVECYMETWKEAIPANSERIEHWTYAQDIRTFHSREG